jgi:prepilin-type processing-associated H-X9-DG protein
MLLMDYLLDRCDPAQRDVVQHRLGLDEFRRHHDDMKNALEAVRLLPSIEPSETLASDTLARIRQKRQTDALLAREGKRQTFRRRPFSVRDLVSTAAAIVLLALVFLPSIRRAGKLAGVGQCAANIHGIGTAAAVYSSDNDGYLPAGPAGRRRWLRTARRGGVSNSESLFVLVRGRYARPGLFQCPSTDGRTGKAFAIRAGMFDFPRREFVGYSYQHAVGGNALRRSNPVLASVADTMAILADSNPIFKHGRFRRDYLTASAGDNHQGMGQNVLYLDGHAGWSDTANVGVRGNNIFLAEGVFDYRGDETPVSLTDTFLLPAYLPRR